jgi:hypothetical protein
MKKFEYYKHLRSFGIEEKDAISMTEQADDSCGGGIRTQMEFASGQIMNFAEWYNTKEGESYWDSLFRKFEEKEIK